MLEKLYNYFFSHPVRTGKELFDSWFNSLVFLGLNVIFSVCYASSKSTIDSEHNFLFLALSFLFAIIAITNYMKRDTVYQEWFNILVLACSALILSNLNITWIHWVGKLWRVGAIIFMTGLFVDIYRLMTKEDKNDKQP